MAKQQTITEKAKLSATPVDGNPGRLLVTLITPGQGSSGYYEPAVLEAAGSDGVFPAGTQMFLDHPTDTEAYERPERSVKDLGAVLAEDARWDGELQALVAEADVFSQHRELLTEMQDHIGVSVRAAGEVSEGKGRRNVTQLVASPGNTVDFVTRAGRGGSFTVLEAARPSAVNRRAVRHQGVSEATVNDQREALDDLLKSTHGGENTYVWLRDFDDSTAWFEISTDDSEKTYSQSFTTGDNGLADAMTGERAEVRQVTEYVPVKPAGQSTESHRGDDMGTTTIEESALADLRETAGQVSEVRAENTRLVTENADLKAENAQLKEAASERTRDERAREIVAESAEKAEVTLSDLEVDGLTRALPLKEGALDEAVFIAAVEKRLTALAESGQIRNMGGSTADNTTVSESDIDDLFKPKEA